MNEDELKDRIKQQEKEFNNMIKNTLIEFMRMFAKASYEQFKRENDSFWADILMVVLFYIAFFMVLYALLNWLAPL